MRELFLEAGAIVVAWVLIEILIVRVFAHLTRGEDDTTGAVRLDDLSRQRLRHRTPNARGQWRARR